MPRSRIQRCTWLAYAPGLARGDARHRYAGLTTSRDYRLLEGLAVCAPRPRCVCAPASLRGITPAIASPIDVDGHDLNGEPLGQNGPHGYLLRRIRSADVVANGIQAPSLAAKNRHHTGATRRVCCTRATSRVVTPICQSSAKPSLSRSETRLLIISPLNLSKKTFSQG